MESRVIVDQTIKRNDYISWDDYFMALAVLSSLRSKDPNSQVGACIVNDENRIVGIGYNGFPAGCSDDELPWCREGEFEETKYAYVCHAEMNAILNSDFGRMSNCRMYVNLFPCNECAKMIIQAGIRRVIYLNDKYPDDPKFVASKRLFKLAGVQMIQMPLPKRKIEIDFDRFFR